MSQHLKVLKDAGLVSAQADGNRRIYLMDPSGIEHLRAYLDFFWNQALALFKTAVETTTQGGTMSIQSTAAPVRTSIVVEAPVQRAFEVFTQEMKKPGGPRTIT